MVWMLIECKQPCTNMILSEYKWIAECTRININRYFQSYDSFSPSIINVSTVRALVEEDYIGALLPRNSVNISDHETVREW